MWRITACSQDVSIDSASAKPQKCMELEAFPRQLFVCLTGKKSDNCIWGEMGAEG